MGAYHTKVSYAPFRFVKVPSFESAVATSAEAPPPSTSAATTPLRFGLFFCFHSFADSTELWCVFYLDRTITQWVGPAA